MVMTNRSAKSFFFHKLLSRALNSGKLNSIVPGLGGGHISLTLNILEILKTDQLNMNHVAKLLDVFGKTTVNRWSKVNLR